MGQQATWDHIGKCKRPPTEATFFCDDVEPEEGSELQRCMSRHRNLLWIAGSFIAALGSVAVAVYLLDARCKRYGPIVYWHWQLGCAFEHEGRVVPFVIVYEPPFPAHNGN